MNESNIVNLAVFGDICPTIDTKDKFKENRILELFGDLNDITKNTDIALANLEFPIIQNSQKIEKTGPVLGSNEEAIKALKKVHFNVLSLANNHIKDYGSEGVINTINNCEQNEIDIFGAGINLNEAKKPLIKHVNGIKIGFLGFAEQEFNIASEKEAGSNYLDVLEDFDLIKVIKSKVDFLIVLYHGGVEYYKYPSPLLQRKCRKMIDSGADLVSCQHSHCIGTKEDFNGGTIVYGQGNSLFGYRNGNKTWNEGLIIKVRLNKTTMLNSEIEFVPIKMTSKSLELMNKDETNQRLKCFNNDSKKILDDEFIKKSWLEYCKSQESYYLPLLFGFGKYFIHLNKLFRNSIVKLFYYRKSKQRVLNVIRCESHLEVSKTILELNRNK